MLNMFLFKKTYCQPKSQYRYITSRPKSLTHHISHFLTNFIFFLIYLLRHTSRYHLLPEQRQSLSSYRTTHRRPEGTKPYLFAIGGGSLFAIHSECEVSAGQLVTLYVYALRKQVQCPGGIIIITNFFSRRSI